jgi:Zn-dependent peptidase ImmA (M78 family)
MANRFGMENKVPVVPPMSRIRIEEKSKEILIAILPEALDSEEPVDIEHIFEIELPKMFPGLKTGYYDLSIKGQGVLGYTSASEKVCLVDIGLYDLTCIENARDTDLRRFRSTVGHEVAHCICHYPYLKVFESFNTSISSTSLMRIEKRIDIKPYQDPEWQAWEMAGALLMPMARIEKDLSQRLSIQKIAEKYEVNPSFAEARIKRILKQK